MCHSCAQAQGCDVQGLTVARLLECEASALVDFVLEVLRFSAAQALPARDRRWLSGPPPEALRPHDSAAATPITHGRAHTTETQPATAPAPYRKLRVAINGDDTSAGSTLEGGAVAALEPDPNGGTQNPRSNGHRGDDDVAAAHDPQSASSGAGAAAGTAAARRAAAGLEYWALQLMRAAASNNGATQAPGGATGAGAEQQRGAAAAGSSAATGAVAVTAGGGAGGAVAPAPIVAAALPASAFSAVTAVVVAATAPAGIVSGSGAAPAGAASSVAGRPSAESTLVSGAETPATAPPWAQAPAVPAAAGGSAQSKGPMAPAAARSHTRGKNPAGGGCASAAEGAGPDQLSLEVWEALAALLLLPGGSQPGGPEHLTAEQLPTRERAEAAGTSGSGRERAPGEGESAGGAPSAPGAQGVDGAGAARRLPTVMDGVVVADADGGCDGRWAAVAEALSRALSRSCSSSGSSSSGSSSSSRPPVGRACAGKLPPPPPPALPALKPEHLRCTHPGLRSVLLAYVLLALSRAGDAERGAAGDGLFAPSSGVDAAAATAVMAGGGSGLPCRSDGGSSGGSGSGGGFGDGCQEPRQLSVGGGPDRSAGDGGGGDSPCCSSQAAAAAAAVAGAAAAAAKPPPASPAPPLPHRRQSRPTAPPQALHSTTASDTLSEHNKLVQREHEERERRRQQQQQSAAGGEAARSNVVVGGAGCGGGMLWTGDGDDAEGEDQEERVLRLWLNSLDPRIQVSSLFEREVATGWPLLQALDAIQPGCVSWGDTFRPPFKEKLRKILSVQNCNQVVEVCTRQLAMPPLVNIGGLDLALGHRRATLSLVFQMMRHHMGMLLGLVAPQPQQTQPFPQAPPPSSPRLPPSPLTPVPSSLPSLSSGRSQGGGALPSPGPGAAPTTGPRIGLGPGPSSGSGSTAATARAGASGSEHGMNMYGHGLSHSHSLGRGYSHGGGYSHGHSQGTPGQPRGHRPHVEVEKAVLAWANAKLTAAAAAAATATATATATVASCGSNNGNTEQGSKGGDRSNAAPAAVAPTGPGFRSSLAPDPDFAPLSSFSDPRLGKGRVLLQLLAAVCPRTVNPKYVLPGCNEEERSSNARYLLSCARKIGCIIFLGWEDVVAARPNLLLLLIASFMALDRKRAGAATAAAAAATAPTPTPTSAPVPAPAPAPGVSQASAGDAAGEPKRSATAPDASAARAVAGAPAGPGAVAAGGGGWTAASGSAGIGDAVQGAGTPDGSRDAGPRPSWWSRGGT